MGVIVAMLGGPGGTSAHKRISRIALLILTHLQQGYRPYEAFVRGTWGTVETHWQDVPCVVLGRGAT